MLTAIRLKLTIWYIVISMLFTIGLSFVIYMILGGVVRYTLQERQLATSEIDGALWQLRIILLIINFFVLCVAGVAGYFLSKKNAKTSREKHGRTKTLC